MAKREIARAHDETRIFCTTASHDMRQPLQAMRLFVYLLQTRGDAPPDPDVLAKMDGSLDAIDALLKELLAGQKPPADSAPGRLMPLVRQACRRLGDPSAVTVTLDTEMLPGDPILVSALVERLIATALPLAGKSGVVVSGATEGHASPGLTITVDTLAAETASALETALGSVALGDPSLALGRTAAAAGYLARILDLGISLDNTGGRCRLVIAPVRPQRSKK